MKEEVRSAGIAKSSEVEIGGWGKRFGRERTYPGRAEICSDTKEKNQNFRLVRSLLNFYVCKVVGSMHVKYYNDEKMRGSCTSHAFPSPFATPPRFLMLL